MATKKIDVSKIEVLKTKSVYGHDVKIEEVPLAEFLKHPEVDTQRDTVGRAGRAYRSHLRNDSPLHALVFLAELPDGQRVVIDACTRRYLWEQGKKTPLETVTAYTVKCANVEDARQFYFHLDNAKAVDRAGDVAFGLLRSQKVQPESELVRKSGYLTGLKKAFGPARKDIVKLSSPLLELLDSLKLANRAIPAGTLAAFFLTALRYGEDCLPFWSNYTQGLGTANEEGRTPPAALARRVEILRAQNKLPGDRNVTRLMETALALFNEWNANPDVLIPDDWNKHEKRETFVKELRTALPDTVEFF
jgi:hypothetical protein